MEQDTRLKVKAGHKVFYTIHVFIFGSLFLISDWPETMLDQFLYLYPIFVAAYMIFAVKSKACATALLIATIINMAIYGVVLCHKFVAI